MEDGLQADKARGMRVGLALRYTFINTLITTSEEHITIPALQMRKLRLRGSCPNSQHGSDLNLGVFHHNIQVPPKAPFWYPFRKWSYLHMGWPGPAHSPAHFTLLTPPTKTYQNTFSSNDDNDSVIHRLKWTFNHTKASECPGHAIFKSTNYCD